MLYAVVLMFRDTAEGRRDELHEAMGAHMMQPLMNIRLTGALFDELGRRAGILMLIEADEIGQVRHFVSRSPYAEADLYERAEISTLKIEAGRLNEA